MSVHLRASGEEQREWEKESEAYSMLSAEPTVELDPTTREIMTRAERNQELVA